MVELRDKNGRFLTGTFNKGRKHTAQSRKNMSLAHIGKMTGIKHKNWKGSNVGYTALHDWVVRWKGKANKCEMCGDRNKKKYEWANFDHQYKRVLDDFISFCTGCHIKYDKEFNGSKHK